MIRISSRVFAGLLVLLWVAVSPTFELAAFAADSSAPKALPPATLARIQHLLAAPQLADAQIGVSIMALGRVDKADQFPSRPYGVPLEPELFASNSGKRFLPASNMKLYTAALAAHSPGGKGHFTTRVYGPYPVRNGELMGPLILAGGGDPSLDVEGLRSLARQVVSKGVRRVRGVRLEAGAGSSEQVGVRYPEGWTLDDALWYYGPEVARLSFHRNQLDLIITGGARRGEPAKVEIEPGFPQFRLGHEIRANIRTGSANVSGGAGGDLVTVDRAIGTGAGPVVVSGEVAPGEKVVLGIAVPNPAAWALKVFRLELQRAGVTVADAPPEPKGGAQAVTKAQPPRSGLLAEFNSPPVEILLRRFLKNSDNLYGEILWRQAAVTSPGEAFPTDQTARANMAKFVAGLGIDAQGLRFSDGSGLSRYNLITPRATTQLLAAIERMGADSVWHALPIAGVDGTLRNRMKGTAAQGNVRAKTGTFSIVSCLSGYVTTRDGHRLAVSILTNFARDGGDARALQNDIFTALAEATLTE